VPVPSKPAEVAAEQTKQKSAEVTRSASMPKRVQAEPEKPGPATVKRVESTPTKPKRK
jgi:hypothetical protein